MAKQGRYILAKQGRYILAKKGRNMLAKQGRNMLAKQGRYMLAKQGMYCTPGDKKREPSKTKFSLKKHLMEQNHFIQQIAIYISVMGGPPLWLTSASLFGKEATPVSTLLHFCSSGVQ